MPIVLSDTIAINGKVIETVKSVGLTPKIPAIPIRSIIEPISSPSVPIITIDSEYKYMSFAYTSGAIHTSYSITFNENTECDILIVGGGGSGGRSVGGGGGAGGVVYQQKVILRGNYIINVGKGGAQTINISSGVDSGNSSQILNNNIILSINGIIYQGNGGGGGGSRVGDPPGNPDGGFNGGSGGGGSCTGGGVPVNGGNSTQGNTIRQNGRNINGGNNALISNITWFPGGGGGAGGNKLNDGGDGIAIDITGINSLYAAGGGGGRISTTGAAIGGSGIGGDGVYNTSSNGTLVIPTRLNGVNGTGSGGGGGAYNYNYIGGPNGDGGGSGGSGIVIIRYKTKVIFIPIPYPYPISINSGYTYIPFINNTGANQTQYSITFSKNIECDILIVGGGGAGGNSMGGGGGAGGVVYAVNQQLNGTYTIGVGNGGLGLPLLVPGGNGNIGIEQDGSDSFIRNADNTADISLNMGGTSQNLRGFGGGAGGVRGGGMAGGGIMSSNGRSGGSGGGTGEGDTSITHTAGISTQPNTYWNGTSYIKGGNAGNTNSTGDIIYIGGGGGGLGGVSSSYVNGKSGLPINITGTSQFYAGGGGGGAYVQSAQLVSLATGRGFGGSSIGGNGRIWDNVNNTYLRDPSSGINGTGSGGGGGASGKDPDLNAGSGGSGIVIIRYATINSQFVQINDDYKYMPFFNTGANQTSYTITFPENTECDILVVGGGGGGGSGLYGGGGGAGGLIFQQGIIFNGIVNISVGKGGTLSNGNNSFVGTYIAIGGGLGGIRETGTSGLNGGSGGGGSGTSATGSTGFGNGTIGQGNNGGNGYNSSGFGAEGGGGGGAGFVGNSAELSALYSDKTGEKAGDGLASKNGIDFKTYFGITNTNIGHHINGVVYFSGGGGGNGDNPVSIIGESGEGGLGGGGFKVTVRPSGGYSALPNTGGGGGGGGDSGGSGIVIIRYKIIKEPYNAQWTYSSTNPSVYHLGNVGIGTTNPMSALSVVGSVSASIGISALSKSFKIEHPLNMNKWLYHGCVEAPRFDNIYRGKKMVTNGYGEVDIDSECNKTGGMTAGTFIALNTNSQLYLRNNQTFDGVKGKIVDGKIIINCQNIIDEIQVDWLVIGERKDENVINVPLTSIGGNLICEHNIH